MIVTLVDRVLLNSAEMFDTKLRWEKPMLVVMMESVSVRAPHTGRYCDHIPGSHINT